MVDVAQPLEADVTKIWPIMPPTVTLTMDGVERPMHIKMPKLMIDMTGSQLLVKVNKNSNHENLE